jgi:hypothetical protein
LLNGGLLLINKGATSPIGIESLVAGCFLGDQMSLWKSIPKCAYPNHFLV